MKRMLSLLLAFLSLASITHASKVLRYEPAVVRLRGNVSLQDFAGPPNFESVEHGDRLERVWILHLKESIRVVASPGDKLFFTQGNVKEVQILCREECMEKVSLSEGKELFLVGTLYAAHTGHHHKSLLMNVLSEK